MADTTISTRPLTYRDPTLSAAADAQLRRARQQSFESLVNQAQLNTRSDARPAQIGRDKGANFQAAQDAVEQEVVAEENPAAQRQARRGSLSASNGASSRPHKDDDDDQSLTEDGQTEATPTVTFSAQQIAQEHLGIGLHVPPLQPADEAYRRAGAEPALETEEVNPSLFALAI